MPNYYNLCLIAEHYRKNKRRDQALSLFAKLGKVEQFKVKIIIKMNQNDQTISR